MKITIEVNEDTYKQATPDGVEDDMVWLRLPDDVCRMLCSVLGHTCPADIMRHGYSREDAEKIGRLYHQLY